VTNNVVSELKSNRAQGRVGPGDPRGGTPPSGRPTPGVYYADLTLGGRAITVRLLVRECKRESRTHARYLYTTDLSLSEEVEEACRVGDRGTPRDVKALGLEDGEASGVPRDLHYHDQRRQGAGGGNEPEERRGVPPVLERRLG